MPTIRFPLVSTNVTPHPRSLPPKKVSKAWLNRTGLAALTAKPEGMTTVTSAIKKSRGVVYFQTMDMVGPEVTPSVDVAVC